MNNALVTIDETGAIHILLKDANYSFLILRDGWICAGPLGRVTITGMGALPQLSDELEAVLAKAP